MCVCVGGGSVEACVCVCVCVCVYTVHINVIGYNFFCVGCHPEHEIFLKQGCARMYDNCKSMYDLLAIKLNYCNSMIFQQLQKH